MKQPSVPPAILVAPLDWGLGHATRCIPIVQELLQQNCRVVLAASGHTKSLLQQEFPHLEMLFLPGYEISYAASAWGLAAKIVAQIPKLFSAIHREHAWLQKVVREHRIDAVISDNRYGLYHPGIPSVFLTHQLQIKAPVAAAERLLQRLNYRYINRFSQCWVPDAEGADNLAGELSHPRKAPSVPLVYTGPLSRFAQPSPGGAASSLLVLLSGPEPQRSLLEKKLVAGLRHYAKPAVLVRGLPGNSGELVVAPHVQVYNHLPAAALAQKISEASLVIARCGYSTVMDLAALGKRSILIPTPGQTEQEYLARHLMSRNLAFCVAQKKFSFKALLPLAEHFSYHPFPQVKPDKLKAVVANFVQLLQLKKV